MGADMWLCFIPCPIDITGKQVQELETLLNNLNDDQKAEFFTAVAGQSYHYDPTDDSMVPPLERLKELVRSLPELIGSRETCFFVAEKKWFLATGGLSWGDVPTDAYEDLDWMAMCDPLIEALSKMAVYRPPLTPEEAAALEPGDTVYWTDPDDGLCSGPLKIKSVYVVDGVWSIETEDGREVEGPNLDELSLEIS